VVNPVSINATAHPVGHVEQVICPVSSFVSRPLGHFSQL